MLSSCRVRRHAGFMHGLAACSLGLVVFVAMLPAASAQNAPPSGPPLPSASETLRPSPPAHRLQLSSAELRYRRGRHQRNVGIALACVGVMVAVTGVALVVGSPERNMYGDIDENHIVTRAVGYGLLATGSGLTLAGAILLPIGELNMKEGRQMGAPELARAPDAAPGRFWGATLRWSF
jgi:hypothetical protein